VGQTFKVPYLGLKWDIRKAMKPMKARIEIKAA
jgi:hypothetical protein